MEAPDRLIRITGGSRLAGTIEISGAKNAALPCLFATLLSDQPSILRNLPAVSDTETSLAILDSLGLPSTRASATEARFTPADDSNSSVPIDEARTMRASILSLGPLLSKRGKAKVPLPGGCDFGSRPIDIHLRGLRSLGAEINMRGGLLHAKVEKSERLIGTRLILPFPSFTGTENLLMAAVLAEGETVIENAAQEPEIVDLIVMLNAMGAKIIAEGSTVTIEGVDELSGADHEIMPDRIEAGTFLAAVMAAGGEAVLENAVADHLSLPLERFADAGAQINVARNSISIRMEKRPRAIGLTTAPYPGFPTDLQAQTLAVNCIAEGKADIIDQVWPQRFRTADELALLGADISVHGNCATVQGVEKLIGAHVQASDLRASAALVIGGLAAQGETVIHGVDHLERGYQDMPKKLRSLGASIEMDQQ